MKRTLVKHALDSDAAQDSILVQGWVRTRRDSKAFSFLEVNDGSCLASIQVIADAGIPGYENIGKMSTGASVAVEGRLVESPGKQKWEIQATSVTLVGEAPESYPLQKKGHSPEFLRTIAHLRPRTNLFGAIFRTRSRIARAVHRFFMERDFLWVHTPIITASDCEGAGEMFHVTTLDPRSNYVYFIYSILFADSCDIFILIKILKGVGLCFSIRVDSLKKKRSIAFAPGIVVMVKQTEDDAF